MQPIFYIALFILSLVWGFSFFFIKILLSFFSPFAIVFYRSLTGAIIILSIMLIKKKNILPARETWFVLFLVGIFNAILPWSLISYSETMISSSMASILNATTPIWTVVVGILFFKSRLKLLQWTGLIIGFSGIFILMDIDFNQLTVNNLYPILGMISAALFYGMAAQISRHYLQNTTVYQISLFTLLISSTISGFLLILTGGFNISYLLTEPMAQISIIGLGCFGSGLAYLVYYFLIQKGSAEFASLVTYLVPISAMFWGMTILGEEITLKMTVGLLLILLGVFISSRQKNTDQINEDNKVKTEAAKKVTP